MRQAPRDQTELLRRAQALAGCTIADVATQLGYNTGVDLRREKGWMGQLLEHALGATAGSAPAPDFPELGIELKTIPVDRHGRPLESTWVCVAPLLSADIVSWRDSLVYRKLRQVLWLPLLAERGLPLQERRIGQALLWQLSGDDEIVLQRDYEHLTERITLGDVAQISAHEGVALQLRPKAANKHVMTQGVGPDGAPIATAPRGFYLRRTFTTTLLQKHFL